MSFKYFFIGGLILFTRLTVPAWSQQQKARGSEKIWIYFTNKETFPLYKTSSAAELSIKPRAIKRRQKFFRQELIDWSDLPVNSGYVQKIAATGARIIVKSRWLNAVTARVTSPQKKQIRNLPFVKEIKPVVTFYRRDVNLRDAPRHYLKKSQTHLYDYGDSYTQNQLIRVPELHDLGITGYGIAVLMLDTGFNYQQHEAFASLKVIDEYDFIFDDNLTRNETGEDFSSQHNHGTQTLSTIGAFYPGNLIGPAFQADYFLAKTENVTQETQIEEDFWVAGLEWGERMGIDVASSSLGYTDWYEYSDYDGNSAVTTIAADIAAKKGVVVVNSMGNQGHRAGSIIAPADADSVISVGAVTSENVIASFSSVGPTWDQRIKPDVMAMGVAVTVVSPNSGSALTKSQGTSFSCPLVAGVAALILSAHPELTPMDVRDALRETADRSVSPDNQYGWGTINSLEAVLYHGLVFSNRPEIVITQDGKTRISIKAVSKNNIPDGQVFIHLRQPDNEFDSRRMALAGTNEFEIWLDENELEQSIEFYFSAIDTKGDTRSHPFNAPEALFNLKGKTVVAPNLPQTLRLLPNFPNPFPSETAIQYQIPVDSYVDLGVYSAARELVRQLVATQKPAGIHTVIWDGKDSAGKNAPDGTYWVILKNNGLVVSRKVDLVQQHQLFQNYPNPFNPSTLIHYQLARETRVALKIYNTLGQLVVNLVEADQPGGRYQVQWDGKNSEGKNVSGGIYFYVLNTDGMYNIKKMTLLR